jgi:hypothetical protein
LLGTAIVAILPKFAIRYAAFDVVRHSYHLPHTVFPRLPPF